MRPVYESGKAGPWYNQPRPRANAPAMSVKDTTTTKETERSHKASEQIRRDEEAGRVVRAGQPARAGKTGKADKWGRDQSAIENELSATETTLAHTFLFNNYAIRHAPNSIRRFWQNPRYRMTDPKTGNLIMSPAGKAQRDSINRVERAAHEGGGTTPSKLAPAKTTAPRSGGLSEGEMMQAIAKARRDKRVDAAVSKALKAGHSYAEIYKVLFK